MTSEQRGRCYGPNELKRIGEAFDLAWVGIAHRVAQNPLAIQAVRLKLANAVLERAAQFTNDVASLTRAALEDIGFVTPPGSSRQHRTPTLAAHVPQRCNPVVRGALTTNPQYTQNPDPQTRMHNQRFK